MSAKKVSATVEFRDGSSAIPTVIDARAAEVGPCSTETTGAAKDWHSVIHLLLAVPIRVAGVTKAKTLRLHCVTDAGDLLAVMGPLPAAATTDLEDARTVQFVHIERPQVSGFAPG